MCAKATRRITALGFAALAAAALPFATPAQAQVTFELCASTGTVTMPDGAVVNIWGFSLFGNLIPDVCDPAQIPGPILTVTEGDDVTVNLADSLPEAATLEFPGQEGVAVTGSSYSFTATAPGTYLYEAGTNPGIQIPMGLYGALIVRPAVSPDQAYADPATAFDTEQVLVLSEIDPDLNNLFNPNDFDRNLYDPVYWLINGEAYPDTDPVLVPPDNRLLLRYVNAGSTHDTMTLVGLRQLLIATDSDPLVGTPDLSQDMVAQTIPTGQTADVIVDAPAAPGRFPLYNRQMRITNAAPGLANPAHFPGGMMTFVTVPAQLFFSTATATAVPGVCPGVAPNVCDDADIYAWSGSAFGRVFDATGAGLAGGANIDALLVEDFDTFYMSFSTDAGTTVPAPVGLAQDEDVVKYDAGVWSLYFDGSLVGLGNGNAEDVDGFEILDDGSVLVSTAGAPVDASIPAAPAPQDEDLLRCDATFPAPAACTWTLYFEGSDVGLDTAASEDIDGAAVSGADIYLSTLGAFAVPATATLSGGGVDVFACNGAAPEPLTSCTSFSMFFDGSAEALPGLIDALDLP